MSIISRQRFPIRRSNTLVRTIPKLGLCSRTESYRLIRSGSVRVNGSIVTDPNKTVGLPADRITISGHRAGQKKFRYILLNKLAGYVTTRKDEKLRPTVYEFLKDVGDWVFPVGRLDKDTEGLLIFTNDTAFGDYLTDPANKIPRTYVVTVEGLISSDDAVKVRNGIDIGRGEVSKPTGFRIVKEDRGGSIVEVTLTEGKNREVRRLFAALGKDVKRLVRTHFGPFGLDDIAPGKWRETTKKK